MKITINEIEYTLKYTLRALFIFEKITDNQFSGKQLIDYYILFYSTLIANNSDSFKYTFDEFIEICDNDNSLFTQFIEFLNKEMNIQNQFIDGKEETEDSKKKA